MLLRHENGRIPLTNSRMRCSDVADVTRGQVFQSRLRRELTSREVCLDGRIASSDVAIAAEIPFQLLAKEATLF